MNPILMAIILVTVIGLIGAVILVAASIVMYVPVDERVEKITGVLAGANCGACGCAGCADYAKSIVEEGAPINKCTPGGAKTVAAIAEIMGVEAGSVTPMKAVVACSGTCEKTSKRYTFEGISSCQAVKGLYGGDGACAYGCLGYGDCTRACAFDAIHIENGIAKVDREKCTGCGACAAVCPNHVIEVVPEHKRKPVVLCQNKDKPVPEQGQGRPDPEGLYRGLHRLHEVRQGLPQRGHHRGEQRGLHRSGEVCGLPAVREGVPRGGHPRARCHVRFSQRLQKPRPILGLGFSMFWT